jgi:hypothetical protein
VEGRKQRLLYNRELPAAGEPEGVIAGVEGTSMTAALQLQDGSWTQFIFDFFRVLE